MARVKTFTNGGGILPSDLNAIQDDYEYAFSTYKTILRKSGQIAAGTATGTYGLGTNVVQVTIPSGYDIVFRLDPADRNANSGQAGAFNRTVYYRIRAELQVGATAPAATFTPTLLRPSAWGTTSQPSVNGFTSVASSTVTITTPAANSQQVAVSADFTLPATDFYYLGFGISATSAAGSLANLAIELQYRQA